MDISDGFNHGMVTIIYGMVIDSWIFQNGYRVKKNMAKRMVAKSESPVGYG